MKTETTAHPVELALLAAVVVIEAVVVLVAALVALLLTVARKPAAQPPQPPAPAATAPLPHPHAALAQTVHDVLQTNTVSQLRAMARGAGLPRALTRNGRKAALIEALLPLELAMT